MEESKHPSLRMLIELGAVLLRVEAELESESDLRRCGSLLLTFDRGKLFLEPTEEGLSLSMEAADFTGPMGLEPLDEEEPWWSLLGQRFVRAWDVERARSRVGIDLQLRGDDEHPKIVSVRAERHGLHVVGRAKSVWERAQGREAGEARS
jgi:hypothetical protein